MSHNIIKNSTSGFIWTFKQPFWILYIFLLAKCEAKAYIINRFNILNNCFDMKLEFWLYKSIFSSFEYSYYGKNGDFLPIYGYFGGHFESCPISRISRIFKKKSDVIASYCVIAYKSDFTLQKSFSHHFQCSNYGQNGNFSPISGYFGGHFERRPIFRIFLNFENMLYAIASYCLLHTNLISNFKKHFLIILVFKLCPKWWFFTYFRIFWRPFWKAPYI